MNRLWKLCVRVKGSQWELSAFLMNALLSAASAPHSYHPVGQWAGFFPCVSVPLPTRLPLKFHLSLNNEEECIGRVDPKNPKSRKCHQSLPSLLTCLCRALSCDHPEPFKRDGVLRCRLHGSRPLSCLRAKSFLVSKPGHFSVFLREAPFFL